MCQVFGAVADVWYYLPPSATAFYGLQMERYLQLHFGDEASPLPVYGWQMERYLQPYLQPYKYLYISLLWRYLGLGCRWQMKMKTIFL